MFNEIFGWLWVTIGFVGGMILGMKFREENWLGGYSAFRRRLVRLGHISFIGLGFVNILFAHSTATLPMSEAFSIASILFVVGAVTMPACCFLVAWRRSWFYVFSVPVVSLGVNPFLQAFSPRHLFRCILSSLPLRRGQVNDLSPSEGERGEE